MEVRPGYKQTEVGVIPEDWDAVRIGDLFTFKNGLNKAKQFFGHGTPIVNYMDVFGRSELRAQAIDGRVDVSPKEFNAYDVRKGDVFFTRTSETVEEIGIAAVMLDEPEKTVYSSFVLRARPSDESLDDLFKAYCFSPRYFRQQVTARASYTTRALTNGRSLSAALLARPSKSEQRAIAAALSDVDALLGTLHRLIAKKRDLKQAVMQQLLTGRTRLPSFHGEWEVKQLGDHVTFLRNGVNSRAELTLDDPVKYLHYGDVHACTDVVLAPNSLPSLPSGKAIALDRLRDGDLVFADASEDLAGVSKSVELSGVGATPVVAGLHTIAARFDKSILADGFKAYLQFCPVFAEQLRRLAAGTKVYATTRAHIASVQIPLPDVKEQSAIALVLADMNAELSALEARRDKTRALKQAMMQELLTGRTRLVTPVVTLEKAQTPRTGRRPANVHFKRSVLAAEIIDRLHQEPTFGHVKFEKMIFLVEHLCEVDTGSTYHRAAAGPYDNRAIRSIDSQLRKQKWFDARKANGRYRYVPMDKHGGHKKHLERHFLGIMPTFEAIIKTFRTVPTEKCEIVATLLGAWVDLIRQGKTISDDIILHEVLNNWHDSKKRIADERWRTALSWMQSKGFVPKHVSNA